ncbi:MAG TPA: site-2 protease family protein [Ktedonobacterales bacterium]|nr:site-2 protease family protein [Ktedonobacterales bacterium]
MPGSFHIGTIAGIKIYINYSWLIILVLLTVSLAVGWFPISIPGLTTGVYYVLGFVAALLLFVSVLAHELAHSLVARARGLPVESISLFIFGGVSNIEREPRSPGVEFQMAIVGPVASLIIGGISWLLALAVDGSSPPLAAILGYLGIANVLLGLFNLIPGFPLDGGRVLRSIIWKATGSLSQATRWAARVGQGVAFLLIFWGILQVFSGNLFGGIWIGFIGWFLLTAAQGATSEMMLESLLRGVRVADVMRPVTTSVPPTLSLRQLTDGYLLPLGLRAVPVVQDERLLGLMTLAEVRRVPRERWEETPIEYVMIPLERLHIVSPEQSLNEVLPMMVRQDINQMPVIQDGRLVGMISRDSIIRFIEVRRSLGLEETEQRAMGRGPVPAREQDAVGSHEPV